MEQPALFIRYFLRDRSLLPSNEFSYSRQNNSAKILLAEQEISVQCDRQMNFSRARPSIFLSFVEKILFINMLSFVEKIF